MNRKQIECDEKIAQTGGIAVLSAVTPEEAVLKAGKLLSAGIRALEIPYRGKDFFDAADACIQAVRREVPEMLVGAATVINPAIARRAVKAGAQFILSPGFNPRTVRYCLHHSIPVYPGVATSSEIERALEFGLSTLKYFPAEALGGVKMLSALAGPFPQVRFIVSGGLNAQNAEEYKKCRNVAVVSGSWLSK
ncbi:bifunctional 4-hydroxy-2-oxoglutarate aldolase/2-dehydro-3-deoxy-phosphogluconate aldolase [uncultured Treponema sp.]|uniref:bifunctional 4-hydroxy-2-oxoglutarate aldolase/2-dehydro-3-deoxy-phosphogluconate aldolase n=1 Tax=uncultured Treponema sp. TaxID=162155 RepID=UPI002591601A|nr:bifunctional 4-hydroxy-2-oxoglutarate aldolase/2-dehydro-3-deoxy-phosphogluconate aldolase [uncultured Treponema sp.]